MHQFNRDFPIQLERKVPVHLRDPHHNERKDLALLRINGLKFGLARGGKKEFKCGETTHVFDSYVEGWGPYIQRLPKWTQTWWFRLEACTVRDWVIGYLPLAWTAVNNFRSQRPAWIGVDDLFAEAICKLVELFTPGGLETREPVTDAPDDVEYDRQIKWIVYEAILNHLISACRERGDSSRGIVHPDHQHEPKSERLVLPKIPRRPNTIHEGEVKNWEKEFENTKDLRANLTWQHHRKNDLYAWLHELSDDDDEDSDHSIFDDAVLQPSVLAPANTMLRERIIQFRRAIQIACTEPLDIWIVGMRARGYSKERIADRLNHAPFRARISKYQVSEDLRRIRNVVGRELDIEEEKPKEAHYRSHKRASRGDAPESPSEPEYLNEYFVLQHMGNCAVVQRAGLPLDESKYKILGPFSESVASAIANDIDIISQWEKRSHDETELRFLCQVSSTIAAKSRRDFPSDFRPPLVTYHDGHKQFAEKEQIKQAKQELCGGCACDYCGQDMVTLNCGIKLHCQPIGPCFSQYAVKQQDHGPLTPLLAVCEFSKGISVWQKIEDRHKGDRYYREAAEEHYADPTNNRFPIMDQSDVDAAVHLIRDTYEPEAIKQRVIEIARRKGFKIPAVWRRAVKRRLAA